MRQKYGNVLVSSIIFKSEKFHFYSNIKNTSFIYLLYTFNSFNCVFLLSSYIRWHEKNKAYQGKTDQKHY